MFGQCLERRETLPTIKADQAEGRRLGVQGTPGFFIGIVRQDGSLDIKKRVRGVISAEEFVAQIEDIRG